MRAGERGGVRRRGPRRRAPRRAWITLAAAGLGLCACEAIVGVDFDKAVLDPGGGSGGDAGGCEPGAAVACYEGAEETLGVGICIGGTRTCGNDGVWGPCEGQILPGVEDASVAGDENCDGLSGECRWAKHFGDGSAQRVSAIAMTPDGTSFITGHFEGELNFGDGSMTAVLKDGYLARFNQDGTVGWSKQLGGPLDQASYGVAAYPDGSVVVGGSTNGPIDLGGGPLNPMGGGSKGFIARYTGSGALLWGRLLGEPASTHSIIALAADPSYGIAVGGHCGQSVDFGNGATPCTGVADMFVALLDASGASQWISAFGNQEGSSALDVDFDADGNVLATSMIYSQVNFGGQQAGALDQLTAVLVKLDRSNGGVTWVKDLGGTGAFLPSKSAVDAQGDILVATSLLGDFDFGNGCPLATGGDGYDVAVVKLDRDGNCLWARHFGAPGDQVVSGLAVDPEGSAVIGGFFKGSVDFGAGQQFPEGVVDAFLVKLGPSGEVVWSRSFGDDMDELGELPDTTVGIGVDGMGNIYATGTFDGIVDFCDSGIAFMSSGGDDLFLAKYAP